MTSLATTESPALPALYERNDLFELDAADFQPKRIYLIQSSSRLRNYVDSAKVGDLYAADSAEDPLATKIGGQDDPVTIYVMSVRKGVVHIDKENSGKMTFLGPDGEDRLRDRETDIWRSYHYIVKVPNIDEPVSWMLTGFSGRPTAQGVNSLIKAWGNRGTVIPVQIKVVMKSNGTHTWAALKPFPTQGDPTELSEALVLQADAAEMIQSRRVENDAPEVVTSDEPTF